MTARSTWANDHERAAGRERMTARQRIERATRPLLVAAILVMPWAAVAQQPSAATSRAAVGRGRAHARAGQEDAKPDRRSDQPAAPEQSELRLRRQGRARIQQHPVRAQHPAGSADPCHRRVEPDPAADHPGGPPARPDRRRRHLGPGRHPAADLPVALEDGTSRSLASAPSSSSRAPPTAGSSARRSGAPGRARSRWSCRASG